MLETEQQNNRKKECNLSVHVDDHLTSKERDQLNQLLSSESNSISNCVNVDLDNLVQRDYSEANRQLLG